MTSATEPRHGRSGWELVAPTRRNSAVTPALLAADYRRPMNALQALREGPSFSE